MSREFSIKICLQRIKILIEKKQYVFVKRDKNMQTLFDLELSINDVNDALLKLRLEDYIGGPEDDYDGSTGQVWVFRHPVSGRSIYIKLKFREFKGQDKLIILSFHPEGY